MFGFFKKKDNRDNGDSVRPAEKAQSDRQPQGPWAQAGALMDQGRTGEALEHFARAAVQTRDLSHMDMAERWLSDPALLDRAGEEQVCLFAALLTQVLDPMEPAQRQRLWEGCLSALRSIKDPAPRPGMTNRYTAECVLLRHMGRTQEALTAAQEGIRLQKAPSCFTFAGLCFLDLGDTAGAEDCVRQSLELDPHALAQCNDLGDYFLDHGNLPKAIEYYAMAVDGGDAQDAEWAEPSLIYCRWLESGDPLELERLALCAASQPQNQRGAQLCQAARSKS